MSAGAEGSYSSRSAWLLLSYDAEPALGVAMPALSDLHPMVTFDPSKPVEWPASMTHAAESW